MRIDPATFFALTAALAACRGAESARATTTTDAAPAPSSSDHASDVDGASTTAGAGSCEQQRFGASPPGSEGQPALLDPLAHECDPMEYTDVPSSCDEGAFGCTTLVNTLHRDVAQRLLACLRGKPGTAICARGVVAQCTLAAIADTPESKAAIDACRSIVASCAKSSLTLPIADCARFLSSMHKCHGIERALSCLPTTCDVHGCLDDWIATWSY